VTDTFTEHSEPDPLFIGVPDPTPTAPLTPGAPLAHVVDEHRLAVAEVGGDRRALGGVDRAAVEEHAKRVAVLPVCVDEHAQHVQLRAVVAHARSDGRPDSRAATRARL
jgi:hypothetical protein